MKNKRNIVASGVIFFIFAAIVFFSGCNNKFPLDSEPGNQVPADTVYLEPGPPLDVEPISKPLDDWLQPEGNISVLDTIEISGHYRVFVFVSYSTAPNESFFLEVERPDGSIRGSTDPNSGNYRVVPDDPAYSGVREQISGIFHLLKGENTIRIRHYSQISQNFPYYLQDGTMSSVHILGLWLEFVGQY